jgi:hypothetical protein
MRKLILAGLLAVGCGPAFQGKVSGYPLNVQETLFATTTDGAGASIGAVLVLSDQRNTCASLAAAKAPADMTVAAFMLTRRADGMPLSPDTGDYTVAEAGTSGASATGVFIHTDANGTNVIPVANRAAVSGVLSISSFTPGSAMSGHFDGKFGSQDDAVTFAFNAQYCSIDSAAIAAGFLGAGTNVGEGGGGGSCTTLSTSVSSCTQYTGSSYTQASTQSACTSTSSGGTWSAGRCGASSNGFCIQDQGTTTEYAWTIYGQEGSALQSTCAQAGGIFSTTN